MISLPRRLTFELRQFLEDSSLDDVTLFGRDDTSSVTAVRAILAARSPVFRTLLIQHHRDAALHVGWCDVDILQLIKEYCYTDTLDSICVGTLSEAAGDDESLASALSLKDMSEASVRRAVRLHESAIYFELPGLASLVEDMVTDAMRRDLTLASVVLDEIENTSGISHFVDAAAAALALAEQHKEPAQEEENQAFEEKDNEEKHDDDMIFAGEEERGGMLAVAVAILRAWPRTCLSVPQDGHYGAATADQDAKTNEDLSSHDANAKLHHGSGVWSFTTGAPLEFLINDTERTVDDNFLLECLVQWAKGTHGSLTASPRFDEAQRIVSENSKTLRLSNVNRTFLLAVVEPSGLASVTQIKKALRMASSSAPHTACPLSNDFSCSTTFSLRRRSSAEEAPTDIPWAEGRYGLVGTRNGCPLYRKFNEAKGEYDNFSRCFVEGTIRRLGEDPADPRVDEPNHSDAETRDMRNTFRWSVCYQSTTGIDAKESMQEGEHDESKVEATSENDQQFQNRLETTVDSMALPRFFGSLKVYQRKL